MGDQCIPKQMLKWSYCDSHGKETNWLKEVSKENENLKYEVDTDIWDCSEIDIEINIK